jgi:hypothetical protein
MGESYYANSREHHKATAAAWTAAQADRLGVTPEAIEMTIQRGWLPDEIDAVTTATELLVRPPDRDVFGLKVVRDG